MAEALRNIFVYRELLGALARKNIIVRYKQAYLGLLWAVLRPLCLVLIFMVVRSFVGIESGSVPYPVLTFAALIPWVFFQDSTSEGVSSVVSNASLIKKIYFPREIFPLTAVLTKLIELGINFVVLAGLMAYYGLSPTVHVLWVPLLVLYIVLFSLSISFAGAAVHVYYRDIGSALPVVLSFLMYVSPVIYPLSLVRQKLIEGQAAGQYSELLYRLYTLNPLAGIIDSFQGALLRGHAPDIDTLWPGLVLTLAVLPVSHFIFKRAEAYFADVI